MHIRKMLLDDYDSVYDIWLNAPGVGLNKADDSREGIAKYLRRNPDTCFVAEDDEGIIGVVLSGHDGRRGLIYHMAVKSSQREQGVGSALLDQAIVALIEEGISKVYIMVYINNDTGHAFWEKRGFAIPDETIYRAREIMPVERIEVG